MPLIEIILQGNPETRMSRVYGYIQQMRKELLEDFENDYHLAETDEEEEKVCKNYLTRAGYF
jgi:hypothetical protein